MKNFIRKSTNWKKQTTKIITVLTLGVGIGWGFFSSQIRPVVALAISSTVNTGIGAQENQKNYISGAEAQTIAAAHAGVTVINTSDPNWTQINFSESNVIVKKCKLDWENGIMVYEVEFFSNSYEYDYEINAITGGIISYKKEIENNIIAIQVLKKQTAGNGNIENIGNTLDSGNGTATGNYIGKERAKEIAYAHAGVSKENLYPAWCEMEREDGILIYELEFQSLDGYKYEYEIHAVTGEILSSKKEQSIHYMEIQANRNGQIGDTVVYIHQNEAEYAAVTHAGVTNYQILGCKLDREDGVIVYEIKFIADIYEYDYKIHAMTGEVVGYKKELSEIRIQNNQTENIGNSNSGNTFISEADARTIVLQHAKITDNSLLKKYEVELKNKKGIYLYEIEFKLNGFEYEYKINAATGEIISYEREWDD